MSFSKHLVLWLHVAFVAFTIGPVTLAIMSTPRYIRQRDVRIVRYLSRMTLVFTLGSLGVAIAGMFLAQMMDKAGKPWVIISATLFLVAILLLVLIVRDQRKAIKALEQAAAQSALGGAAGPADDAPGALTALADLAAPDAKPVPQQPWRPALPDGDLTGESAAAVIGALLPEDAIVSDEANTSGLWLPGATAGTPPHDWLTLTGGAIGQGLPLATGAALASPGRRVLALEADGSAMYTISALWTHAREGLDITTIIFSNRAYAILGMELDRAGATAAGEAARSLLDLSRPSLNFAALAEGMGVPASRASTAAEFAGQLRRATGGARATPHRGSGPPARLASPAGQARQRAAGGPAGFAATGIGSVTERRGAVVTDPVPELDGTPEFGVGQQVALVELLRVEADRAHHEPAAGPLIARQQVSKGRAVRAGDADGHPFQGQPDRFLRLEHQGRPARLGGAGRHQKRDGDLLRVLQTRRKADHCSACHCCLDSE